MNDKKIGFIKQTCYLFIQGDHRAGLFKLSGRINKPDLTVEYTNDSAVICVFYRVYFEKSILFDGQIDTISYLQWRDYYYLK